MIKVLTTLSNNSAEGVTSTGLLKTPLALSGTLQVVEDYAGTNSPLYLSETQVGITTTTPTGNNLSTLTITGATTGGNYLNIIGANGDLYVGVSRSDGGDFSVPAYSSVIGTNNFATGLAFVTQGITRAYITATGNVGIGTTSPAQLLHIYKTSGAVTLRLEDGNTNYWDITSNSFLKFGRGGSSYMYFDPNGKIAVGYTFTTPAAQLDIVAAASTVGLYVTGAASTDIARFYTSGGSTYTKFSSDGSFTLPLNTYVSTTNLFCDQINDNGNLKTILQFGNYGGYSNTDFIINTTNATITIGAAITQYQFLKFDTAMTAGANNQTMIGMRVNATFVDNSKTGLTKYIQQWAVAGVLKAYIESDGSITTSGSFNSGSAQITGGSLLLTSGVRLYAGTVTGSLNLLDNNAANGVQLNVATANLLKIRTTNNSGYGDIDAGVYKVNGNAGFTGTGIFTSFTIEGGIITAAS